MGSTPQTVVERSHATQRLTESSAVLPFEIFAASALAPPGDGTIRVSEDLPVRDAMPRMLPRAAPRTRLAARVSSLFRVLESGNSEAQAKKVFALDRWSGVPISRTFFFLSEKRSAVSPSAKADCAE